MQNISDRHASLIKNYYPLTSDRLIKRIDNRIIKENEVEQSFYKKVEDFILSGNRVLALAFDGFSGVGKSTAINLFRNVTSQFNVTFKLIECDKFLGCVGHDRESLMLQDFPSFLKLFYNRGKLTTHILKACTISPGDEYTSYETYDRDADRSLTGTQVFESPEGKFVLVIDGVTSMSFLNAIRNLNDVQTCGFFVMSNPANSILRATFRDLLEKGRSFESVLPSRLGEYFFLRKPMMKSILGARGILINDQFDSVLRSQIDEVKQRYGEEGVSDIQGIVRSSVHNFWANHVSKVATNEQEVLFSSVLGSNMSKLIFH